MFTDAEYYNYTTTRDASGRRQRPRTYSTDLLTRASVRFLRDDDTRPFFLLVGYNAPHQPATPASKHKDELFEVNATPNFNEAQVGDKPAYIRSLPLLDDWGELVTLLIRLSHYRALRSLDDGLAAMFGALEETGRLDDTLVIYSGDNGYSFGAHRWDRKRAPYDESARVPLLMRYRGSSNKHSPVPASSIDLAATIVDVPRALRPGRGPLGDHKPRRGLRVGRSAGRAGRATRRIEVRRRRVATPG